MKVKLKLLLLSISISALFLTACSWDDEGEVFIPDYQEAIYIMDADGSNKTKVLDVDGCQNVQFIPNSDKLLYLADNSLYTVNTDGTENVKISEELNVRKDYPAVSENGDKIVFAVYYAERDYIYDLYLTDANGNNLENITNTPDKSEKEASFIHYEGQECLLYVSYFRENDKELSTISLKYLSNVHKEEILYCRENNDSIEYGGGYRYPTYGQNSNKLIANYGTHYDTLLLYDQLENGTEEILSSNNLCSISTVCHNETNKILFFNGKMCIYDLNTMSYHDLIRGYNYSFSKDGNRILFTYSLNEMNANIAIIEVNTSEHFVLSSGIKPKFNKETTAICYIDQYVVNPKSNYIITN